jgi:uncharacterized protein (DUF2062 family)
MKNQSRRLRQWFLALEPRVLAMMNGPMLKRIKPWADKHDVFSFTREPLARGLGFGLFCSLIPGPLQMLGALAACVLWRGNIVAGFCATLVSNPLTILPLYIAAFNIGAFILPGQVTLPSVSSLGNAGFGTAEWYLAMSTWLHGLGWPLVVGLPVLGLLLAGLGYAIVQITWLLPVYLRYRAMRRKVS